MEWERRPSSSILCALTWRWRTPMATAEKTMSATGVRTASVRSRQLSASSPASSRASGGARVLTEVERWKKDFFTAGDTYLQVGVRHSAITQVPLSVHIRGTRGKHATYLELSHVPTPAKFVGCSFRLLRISTIKMIHLNRT